MSVAGVDAGGYFEAVASRNSWLASTSGSAGVPKGTVAIENESYLEVIPALIKRDHSSCCELSTDNQG